MIQPFSTVVSSQPQFRSVQRLKIPETWLPCVKLSCSSNRSETSRKSPRYVQLSPPPPAFPWWLWLLPSLSPGLALWRRWPLPALSTSTSVECWLFYFIYYSFFSNMPTWPSHLVSPNHLQSQPGPTAAVAVTSPSPSSWSRTSQPQLSSHGDWRQVEEAAGSKNMALTFNQVGHDIPTFLMWLG